MRHFHKNLHYLMYRQAETQVSVAEFVGVSQPSVSNWLQDTMPQEEQLEKIAQFFQVPLDDLVNHALPHRENIRALTELERVLRKLKSDWDGVARRLKESAEKLATQREYSGAVQNDWMASGMEGCSNELAKVLEVYFPDNAQNKNLDHKSQSNGSSSST